MARANLTSTRAVRASSFNSIASFLNNKTIWYFFPFRSRDSSMKDGEGAYFYQIITEKDDSVKIAQVQNILEDSFFSADIILAEVSIDL